jgi:hypothetical protein
LPANRGQSIQQNLYTLMGAKFATFDVENTRVNGANTAWK